MKIEYLRLDKAHEAFIKEMLHEALFVAKNAPKLPISIIEEDHMKKYYENWGRLGDLRIVAINNNEPIGASWSRLFNFENKAYGYVNDQTPELSIALKSEYRNNGIGTILLKKLMKENKKLGIKQISLSVDKLSPVMKLYDRLGFEIYADDRTAFTMLKKLAV